MEKIDLVLSIIASVVSILAAVGGFNFYNKTKKIYNKINHNYSDNYQNAGNNSTQIIGEKNKVR